MTLTFLSTAEIKRTYMFSHYSVQAITLLLILTLLAACARPGKIRHSRLEDTSESVCTDSLISDSLVKDDMSVPVGKSLTFALVGDIMMGTTFPDSVHGSFLPVDGGEHLFDACRELLLSADVAAGNLEGTFLDAPGTPRQMTNPDTYYAFRTPTSYVFHLVDAGFDFMGVANNHFSDFGASGQHSTLATLRDAGIAYAGLRGRAETSFMERRGMKIGITQFAPYSRNLDINDMNEVKRVVGALRDSADIVVISFHGGAEGKDMTHVPFMPETFVGEQRGNVVEFARAAVDAGADIVFGHGPHVPRAAELYKDRIIFYSLGNFCTPARVNISGVSGYAPLAFVRISSDGKFIEGRIHSYKQRPRQGPVVDSDNSAARMIRDLTGQDFPATPLIIGTDGELKPVR